jgi:broad specificity phosphatase PhoE
MSPSAAGAKGIAVTVEIVFETHSLTEDNENGIATGWLPGRLSARGRALAAQLGRRYRDTNLAAVFVSDLHRAVETVTIAFAGVPIAIHQDERLRECNYGDLNGCPVGVLAGLRSRHIDLPFPGGQSYRQVVMATASFLKDLRSRWDGSRVLVIAHSANKWALDCLLGDAKLENLVAFPLEWKEGWVYVLDRPSDELFRANQGGHLPS